MFKTKYEDNSVTIGIEEKTLKSLAEQRFNHLEIFRLIESFAQKLLASGEDGEVSLKNDDTGATIDITVEWNKDAKEVSIEVVDVDLKQVDSSKLRNLPRGAKVDLNKPASEVSPKEEAV